MSIRVLMATLVIAVGILGLPLPGAAPAHTATEVTAWPVHASCSSLACTFYFTRSATSATKKALDRTGWFADPAGALICGSIPNRVVGAACIFTIGHQLAAVKRTLNTAHNRGGCFAVEGRLRWKVISYTAVARGHRFCSA
ncbi:hypothetical protein [Streptosporangium sp. NPDC006007]|uniref:hypothetical protein n=1 Tax=Streptosporangium sp. NPDC006007 TaxID=3154575 RepID=UPI0033B89674